MARRAGTASLLLRLLFGPLLLIGAMALIWWNEGRVNLADVAEGAVAIAPAAVDPAGEGELISLTGTLATAESLSDDRFLRPGAYVWLRRVVEMYAWEEVEESDDDGGTTISYRRAWLEAPQPPEAFADPRGHENPPLPFPGQIAAVRQASVGAYRFDPLLIDLPRPRRLALGPAVLRESPYPVVDDFLFLGDGTMPEPQLGDVRVRFEVVPAAILVTAFARPQGEALTAFNVRDRATLFRLLEGDRQTAIAQLEREYQTALWSFRLLGLLLTWGGIALVLSPISALFGVFPGLGRLSRRLVALVSLLLAAPLAALAIAVAYLTHNPLALIGALVVIIAIVYVIDRRRSTRAGS